MGSLSIWHLLIVLAVVVLVFGGGGKLSRIMGDFGKGINSFKSGLKSDEERKREEEEARGALSHDRPPGTQTVEGGVRQDDVIRR
jgi:sec-independent protein translocase protein TatA